MKHVFVVTLGAHNSSSLYQFAFEDLEDAKFFRDDVDKGKGASHNPSTIHVLDVREKGQY